MFDAIVVGSGPSGVFAARQLRPLRVLLLDVGMTAPARSLPEENLYELKRRGAEISAELLGERFESLHNIEFEYLSPKLKGPLMRFITQRPEGAPKDDLAEFDAVISYAQGGLANAWGAGAFRFDDHDLEGFPLKSSELDKYYDELTAHIGISGEADDLLPDFGSAEGLLPGQELSPTAQRFMSRYAKRRAFLNRRGIRAGRTRAAILTRELNGRKSYTSLGQDFFQPNIPAIYHPGYTLRELVQNGEVEYRSSVLVERFKDTPDGVEVFGQNLESRTPCSFSAKRLFLAAGAINSARIVLASYDDYESRLPLLDNPVTFLPLIDPLAVGSGIKTSAFAGAELFVVYNGHLTGCRIQASMYSLNAPLRTDLLREFPLAAKDNLALCKYFLPAMSMLQLFYPDAPNDGSYLRLKPDLSLELRYQKNRNLTLEKHLIASLVRLGYLSLPQLCRMPKPGSSIHYAGPLPMKQRPEGRYETDPSGRLNGTRAVYVTDAAVFPKLPSKNLTFTIMANAMRIAEESKRGL